MKNSIEDTASQLLKAIARPIFASGVFFQSNFGDGTECVLSLSVPDWTRK